ncbi:MAG TPA: multidrug efflux RND transporter permease subunit [Candidatus Methylomirabilis sp.]|nr:multidrug efflux RND transporter permease subunit [Candidatus Methylomirabilis sp.]
MARFFINRPVVAMVISILMVIIGAIAMVQLPIAQYPNIAPPEILLTATYPGADALTLEQSVATPIEQQMSGVDNMIYMYSTSQTAGGQMQLRVDFDITTDPSYDQVLTNLRYTQAQSQLPQDVINQGVTVIKSVTSPLGMFVLYSPKGTYDALFLSNYAYVNLNDPLTRVPGVGQVQIFGAGKYAIRLWVNPDTLGKLDITVNEIMSALQAQNTVNPAGQVGGEPAPKGQEFTYAVRAQGRLASVEDFENVVVRAKPDGSLVRVKDVARVELGAQTYTTQGRLNGRPGVLILIYQLPGANAIETMKAATKLMEQAKARFPQDLEYVTALDTTLAVSEGIHEIVKTLFEAIALVVIVVFIFLQGFRATLIPLLAVPVSLVGTFMVFPLLGFSVNTLSLFGLVLAIGLVVDDAIVVVEAVEHHIEEGLSPRDAAFKAMEEVSGPVVGVALVLSAVFIPTALIPGITGRMYQQFAVTIAVSVIISAFNALSLSPALSALLLRPRREMRGPLGVFFRGFNRWFGRATEGYVGACGHLIRKSLFSMLLLAVVTVLAGLIGSRLPGGFVPDEDQGYLYLNVQLPLAASLQRTAAVNDKIDAILKETPGVKYYTGVAGFSLLSFAFTTYNSFYFVTLEDWAERDKRGLTADVIMRQLNMRLAGLPDAQAFAFSPPVIPGIGTSGGVTFMLEDRAGKDPAFLAENTAKFLAAARQRPEFALLFTTLLPGVPQLFADVDREKVLKQGINLGSVYQTLQAFMGSAFVNYFNQFGRVWQVYIQAEGNFRTKPDTVAQFYVRNASNQPVPLSSLVTMKPVYGPEFSVRFNEYRAAQINGILAPGVSSRQGMQALEKVFAQTMPREMGFDYSGMSFQEQAAAQGIPAAAVFGFSLLIVFLLLAALYESWTLPFGVLLGTPIAVLGAVAALWLTHFELDVFSQIGLIMVIGLAAKNAILIVEFAKVEHERGASLVDAALAGARVRLRPILMTAFAFILGVVPLVVSTGAGANSRHILGTTVIGGMLAATVIAIFIIPVTYYVSERFKRKSQRPATPPAPVPAPISGGGSHEPPADRVTS